MSNEELARKLDQEVRQFSEGQRKGWIALGQKCRTMREKKLWGFLGHATFAAWLQSALNSSRSLAFEAMKILDDMKDMGLDVMATIPKSNLKMLAKLPESKRYRQDLVEAAKTQESKDFRKLLNAEHGTHLETPTRLTFTPPKEALPMIERALKAAKTFGAPGMDPIEVLCVYYLQGPCEEEGYERLSNEEALTKAGS